MSKKTEISNAFIDRYFAGCNPSYIMVYVALLRLDGNGPVSPAQAADFLDVMESDITRAISYWERKGVIRVLNVDGQQIIEFLPVDESDKNPDGEISENIDEIPASTAPPPIIIAERCPTYSTKEIDFYIRNNSELSALFKRCEGYLGKLLTYNDMSTLFSFHDWLRLPFDIIDMLVSYCSSNDRRSMRYIERIALTWSDAGINTKEKAEARIKLYNGDFRAIMREMGKPHRDPIKKEEEFMLKWLKTYGLPLEVAIAACTRTVMQAARPTFKYADSIIEKWHIAGLSTIADIERAEAEFNKSNYEPVPEKRQQKKSKRTKFSNFSERDDIDFAERQRLEMERVDRELGFK